MHAIIHIVSNISLLGSKINISLSINSSSIDRNAKIVSVGRYDRCSNPSPPLCVCDFLMTCHFVYLQKKIRKNENIK
jgi:hypothetical protein